MEQPDWYIHLVHFISIIGLAFCSYKVGELVGRRTIEDRDGQ